LSAATLFAAFAARWPVAGLFQQSFGLHGGLNAVEHNADAGRQLFKKRKVGRREGVQRGKFNDRLDAIFK